jgi:hypothetical protein
MIMIMIMIVFVVVVAYCLHVAGTRAIAPRCQPSFLRLDPTTRSAWTQSPSRKRLLLRPQRAHPPRYVYTAVAHTACCVSPLTRAVVFPFTLCRGHLSVHGAALRHKMHMLRSPSDSVSFVTPLAPRRASAEPSSTRTLSFSPVDARWYECMCVCVCPLAMTAPSGVKGGRGCCELERCSRWPRWCRCRQSGSEHAVVADWRRLR